MVENERQYRITRSWIDKFRESIRTLEAEPATDDPLLNRAMLDQYSSQVEELVGEIAAYEALRDGTNASVELDSLRALPDALIQARIAAGLTQRELARCLGVREQQVQRYEATRYRGVSLERAQAVMDALGVRLHQRLSLPSPDRTP